MSPASHLQQNSLRGEIILVEDDLSLQKAFNRILVWEGYTVVSCVSAEELFQHVTQWQGAKTVLPRCIIMDVNLPGISGVEAQQRLKEVAQGSNLPVIFISGKADVGSVDQAWRDGAYDFLLKPFEIDDLLAVIDKALGSSADRKAQTGMEQARLQQQLDLLSPREKQVFKLVAEGYTNQAIGDELTIAVRTVKMHRINLMRKLDMRHITDLVRFFEQCRDLL